mgnify:CR=1 FL=1
MGLRWRGRCVRRSVNVTAGSALTVSKAGRVEVCTDRPVQRTAQGLGRGSRVWACFGTTSRSPLLTSLPLRIAAVRVSLQPASSTYGPYTEC